MVLNKVPRGVNVHLTVIPTCQHGGPPEGPTRPTQGPPGPPEGPSQISGDLEIWGPGNQGISNPKKYKKKLRIQIRSAKNVGKVWIGRKKSSWPDLGPSQVIFSMGRIKKNVQDLPISLGGPMGPIHRGVLLFA